MDLIFAQGLLYCIRSEGFLGAGVMSGLRA
jgi:hypothetical protein